MLKRTIAVLVCLSYLIPTFSQSWDEIKNNSNAYLYGEGWGATVEEADQQALTALISQISLIVSSDFTIIEDERMVNGNLDATSYTNSKLQTYSAATLTNTERVVIDNKPDEAHIGRYIKRSEINRIFEGRKRTVNEHIRLGLMAESSGKIDDALRNYYWAFSLLKSIQRPAEVTYYIDETGAEIHPLTWLPERIRSVMNDLDVKISGYDGTNIDLLFTYKGDPVSSLDFTYFDGRNWSNISSVKNGRGTMEFSSGMVPENVQINYEYAYRGQAHINQEIKSVLDVVKGQAFKEARVNLHTGKIKASEPKSVETTIKRKPKTRSISPVANEKPYREILSKIVAAIKKDYYNDVIDYFTEDGKDMFGRLIMYGNARVLNANDCVLYQFGDNVVARSIQMSFTFKHGVRKNFVEDIVFTFNADGKIDCVAFGLDKKAKDDIMNRGAWPEEARQTIIEFLENYKTAYALKRLDYIRTIFDDNAVIIVGHVANRMEPTKGKRLESGMMTYKNHKYVTRTQYSKEQYLKHLEACFNSNEYINIRFANNDVRKAKDGEEYGIQIKQDYYSTNYGDEGYLYIQVDLNDRKEPIIKVRTWQPEPDPEIGLFGIGNW